MYIVLGKEIADVDLAEFDKVGSFLPGVLAVPLIDVSVGLKGMPTSLADREDECQNSIILSYEAPEDDEQLEAELVEDPFTPGVIYRYRRTTQDYVELMYKARLGALAVYIYFLVRVGNCAFAYQEKENQNILNVTPVTYADLWKIGLVREAKS